MFGSETSAASCLPDPEVGPRCRCGSQGEHSIWDHYRSLPGLSLSLYSWLDKASCSLMLTAHNRSYQSFKKRVSTLSLRQAVETIVNVEMIQVFFFFCIWRHAVARFGTDSRAWKRMPKDMMMWKTRPRPTWRKSFKYMYSLAGSGGQLRCKGTGWWKNPAKK